VTFRLTLSDGRLNFAVLQQDALLISGDRNVKRPLELPSYFFACFLTFAQRFFAGNRRGTVQGQNKGHI
jgi:hypothetical protein